MRRIIIQGLLSCLLALFPGLTLAQTLTSFEYWFDDGFERRQSVTIHGGDFLIETNIDTRQLSQGVHSLSFRAKQSDGMYSAISSSS